MQWNCYTVEFIYLYHSPTLTLFVAAYICKLIIYQQRRCWRERGFHGNTVHKAELLPQTLLYQTLHARWNENDIQNVPKTVGFHQKYSDINTPALGLILKRAVRAGFTSYRDIGKTHLLIYITTPANKNI